MQSVLHQTPSLEEEDVRSLNEIATTAPQSEKIHQKFFSSVFIKMLKMKFTNPFKSLKLFHLQIHKILKHLPICRYNCYYMSSITVLYVTNIYFVLLDARLYFMYMLIKLK